MTSLIVLHFMYLAGAFIESDTVHIFEKVGSDSAWSHCGLRVLLEAQGEFSLPTTGLSVLDTYLRQEHKKMTTAEKNLRILTESYKSLTLLQRSL